MAQSEIWAKLNSKFFEITNKLGRIGIRSLAVIAIVGTYGLGQALSVVGISGVVMTASSTPADARGGRGGWGRGGGWHRGGWGRGGWGRGWHRGCRGWRGGRCWWWW